MIDLALGDKVAVRVHNDGQVIFEDGYAFGHKDPMSVTKFVQLTLKPIGSNVSGLVDESRILELSARHFAPLVVAENSGELLYKRGMDISVGDHYAG